LVTIETLDATAAMQALQNTQWQATSTENGFLQLRLHRNDIPFLNQYLVEKGIPVTGLVSRHSLEDYFLSLTTYNQHVAPYTD
jgi:hypothetical protein